MGVDHFTKPNPFEEGMNLAGFESGTKELDEWLANYGRLARRHGTAVVFVSYAAGANSALDSPAGYYTLSSSAVDRVDVSSGWLKRNTPEKIPVILLGMLAVDKRFQGRGLGVALLHDAATRAKTIAESLGAKALVVDPIDEAARRFYKQHGFRDIPGTTRMFAKLI